MAILVFDRVGKSFGQTEAVSEVSLEVNKGEILALLGPSGCGKTTSLRMMAGLERCTSGEIVYRGEVIDSLRQNKFLPTEKRDMGMVFQSYAIWPNMSVFENIAFPLRVRGASEADIESKVRHVADLVGLAGLEQRRSTELSGGQQQRVAVARCLVFDPEIILLDEPFSNLDAKLREHMRLEMKLLQKRIGATIVMVTHDQTEALSLADRIAVMNRGAIEQIGTPQELYLRPATPFVRDFLGQTVRFEAVVNALGEDGTVAVTVESSAGYRSSHHRLESPVAGQPCAVVVRPGDVRIERDCGQASDAGGCVILRGRIETLLFMGEHYDALILLSSGRQFMGTLSKRMPWQVQQEVAVFLPADALIWPA